MMAEEAAAKKAGPEILRVQREEANREYERPSWAVSLSALSAGLDLGFSLLLMAVLSHLLRDAPDAVQELGVALAYSLGFLFVILGRSELFTEHTTLDILPVLSGEQKVRDLLRMWALIYFPNLVGAATFAWFAGILGPAMGIFPVTVLGTLADEALRHPTWVILLSAVLAGWLMGLVSWLVAASRDTVGQILVVIMVTGTLGLCHLHHCVEGSAQILSALFTSQASWAEYGRFLGAATLGNSIGGAVFVAIIKHGHLESAKAE